MLIGLRRSKISDSVTFLRNVCDVHCKSYLSSSQFVNLCNNFLMSKLDKDNICILSFWQYMYSDNLYSFSMYLFSMYFFTFKLRKSPERESPTSERKTRNILYISVECAHSFRFLYTCIQTGKRIKYSPTWHSPASYSHYPKDN